MTRLAELNKLEEYLKSHGIKYERIDHDRIYDPKGYLMKLERHQICVPVEDGDRREWDAICQWGSYGYEEGLLEIMGSIVHERDGDSVVGWLTAEDVIQRIEKRKGNREKNNGKTD